MNKQLAFTLIFLLTFSQMLFAFDDCDKLSGLDRQTCRIANNVEIVVLQNKDLLRLDSLKIQMYKQQSDACKAIDETLNKQLKNV